MKVVLGSNSPRRKHILSSVIDDFTVIIPHVDETPGPGENPVDFTRRVSLDKVVDAAANISPHPEEKLVISADTIVAIDGKILGKPADFQEARMYISMLNGRTHRVITSISFMVVDGGKGLPGTPSTYTEITEVTFKNLSPPEIDEYLNSIEYMDKAGAYAFQSNGNRIVASLNGSVTNVIGFPLRSFFFALSECGILRDIYGAGR